jgi:hypothetical protein
LRIEIREKDTSIECQALGNIEKVVFGVQKLAFAILADRNFLYANYFIFGKTAPRQGGVHSRFRFSTRSLV